jgi:hypothetical protein
LVAPPTQLLGKKDKNMNAVTKKTVILKDTGETVDGVTVLGD